MDLLGTPLAVGVDLGKRTIKVVAVRQGKPPRLVSTVAYQAPAGAIDGSGAILDPFAAVDALRAALHQAGIRGGRAVVGMGGRSVIVRHLTLPPMPEDELKTAVKWEAERNLPLHIEDAVLDAQVLREVTEEGQRRLEVLMAAVPERDALLYHKIATDAGLDVVAIETTSMALARTLEEYEGTTVAVDVGPDLTEIVIVSQRLPLVCRNVPVGGEGLWQGTPGEAAGAGGEAVADPPTGFDDLLIGLTRSMDYFEAHVRGKIDRVVVTGDGALAPGVVPMLSGALAVPVEVGNPFVRFTGAPAVLQAAEDRAALFAVATGLAMRTLP